MSTRRVPNYPLRLDPLRRAGWKRAAELEGRTLAGWIKSTCDHKAATQLQRRPTMYTEQEMDEMDEGFDSSVPCTSICRDCGTPIPPSGRHDCYYDRDTMEDEEEDGQ